MRLHVIIPIKINIMFSREGKLVSLILFYFLTFVSHLVFPKGACTKVKNKKYIKKQQKQGFILTLFLQ
jgi:hypothetical protein